MPRGMKLRLDHRGMEEVLKSVEVAAEVEALADEVAANAREDDAVVRNEVEVRVSTYETDRAAAAVTLADPAGLPIEAKHGSLTRAATAAGLEVRSTE